MMLPSREDSVGGIEVGYAAGYHDTSVEALQHSECFERSSLLGGVEAEETSQRWCCSCQRGVSIKEIGFP